MEPDAAALSLTFSPYHLVVPRSFYFSEVQSVGSQRVKGVPPYGISPHCLLSTDSLVPLLPITSTQAHTYPAVFDVAGSDDSILAMDLMQPAQEPKGANSGQNSPTSTVHPV